MRMLILLQDIFKIFTTCRQYNFVSRKLLLIITNQCYIIEITSRLKLLPTCLKTNDKTLPDNWKSYHKMKIIPVNFRQFPPIFRRPQRQNESLGRILQKTNILDLNLASIHKKSWACSPNGSRDMTISAGNNFYTIKLRSTHNKEQSETNEVSIY